MPEGEAAQAFAEPDFQVERKSGTPTQYFRMIGFLKPEASRSARPCAKVAESLNGPTNTRKRLSLGPGATMERKPFLPRASLMISASGREVATTCQYCPGGGSPVADAGAEGVKTCGLVSFAGTGGGGLAAVLAGFSGCVTGGPAAVGFEFAGSAEGLDAGLDAGFDAVDESVARSTTIGFAAFSVLVRVTSATTADELRPTMYPIENNTASRITTIRNTLMSCRFPSTNSNSPSSFLAKLD